MEAKDTVMTGEQMLKKQREWGQEHTDVGVQLLIEHQAEITWPIAKQAGIREVMEWIESLDDAPTYSVCEGTNIKIPEPPSKLVLRKELQAKKKDWGL